MKRIIVINETRSALVVSDDLAGAVKQVATDCGIGEEIYAFDTYLHVGYVFKTTKEGFEIIEDFIPLKNLRSFAERNYDYSEVYKSVIRSVTGE